MTRARSLSSRVARRASNVGAGCAAMVVAVYMAAVWTTAGQRFEDAVLRSAELSAGGGERHPVRTLATVTVLSLVAAVAVVVGIALLRRRPSLAVAGAAVIAASVARLPRRFELEICRALRVGPSSASPRRSAPLPGAGRTLGSRAGDVRPPELEARERIGNVAWCLGVPARQSHFSNTLQCREILRWMRDAELTKNGRLAGSMAVYRMYLRRERRTIEHHAPASCRE